MEDILDSALGQNISLKREAVWYYFYEFKSAHQGAKG
jgi:hypothetical protein